MLAYDIDLPLMLDVLRMWEEKVADKAIESAKKRVAPLRTIRAVARDTVIDRMIETFAADRRIVYGDVTDAERQAAQELVTAKYGTDDWTFRVDRKLEAQ
jgi:lipoate-protein ligase A